MKLLILGATGGTGLEVVRTALERRHTLSVLVRSPERLGKLHNSVHVTTGNVLDSERLREAVRGHDAVVSAFGPRNPVPKGEENLLRDFASVLVPALEQNGVKRVVVESTSFLFKDAILPPANLIGRIFFADRVRDATAMEEIFQRSHLQWTLVRPTRLTDKSATNKYRIGINHLPPFAFSITRADAADCLVKSVEQLSTIHQVLGVTA